MYAGSATHHRSRGDTALLRFEAMRWARRFGCTHYDLGGIGMPGDDPANGATGSVPAASESDLGGVRQFKLGFGGDVVDYLPTLERRYWPGFAWLLRRIHSRFRPVAV